MCGHGVCTLLDDSRSAVGRKLISAGDSAADHIVSVENKEGQRTLRCVVRRAPLDAAGAPCRLLPSCSGISALRRKSRRASALPSCTESLDARIKFTGRYAIEYFLFLAIVE